MKETDSRDKPTLPVTGRRSFVSGCGSAAALLCAGGHQALAAANQPLQSFAPSVLVDAGGHPVAMDAIEQRTEYIFHYPYRSTPCFLIDLGEAVVPAQLHTRSGDPYHWTGGVGPGRSIVAFSAICAHKLSHPTPVVSFIGYRADPVGFLNRSTNRVEKRAGVIQCCSEHSIYDPARGASVVSGPAPQPLAAIALTVRDGQLLATGVSGGAMFDQYFERFGDRLMLEYKSSAYAAAVGETTRVVTGEQFSANQMRCG